MTPDIQWAARFDETKAFVAAHGRLPRQKVDSDEERRLGNWLTKQRRRSDRAEGFSPHTEEQTAALNAELPGWRGRIASPPVPWEQRLSEVKTYRDAYGKWPSYRSKDPQVQVLATWVNMQRRSPGGGPEVEVARRKILDEQLPGWNETPEQAWYRIADDVAAFRDRIGEWPSYSSGEASVRRLAKWLLDQRTGRNVSPEREQYLDGHLAGWRIGLGHGSRPVEIWEEGIAAVEQFLDSHGRLPRTSTRNRAELRPGHWLERQRLDKDMPTARRRILDARVPGWEDRGARLTMDQWREAQKESWNGKLDDVVRFVGKHDRAPFLSDDPALYGWLTRLRDREITPERQAVLDARLPGWRGVPGAIRRPGRAA